MHIVTTTFLMLFFFLGMSSLSTLVLLGTLQVAHILDVMVPAIVENVADYILRSAAKFATFDVNLMACNRIKNFIA